MDPAQAARLLQHTAAIQHAAARLACDPAALDVELARLARAAPLLRIARGDPLNATAADVLRVQQRAARLIDDSVPTDEAYTRAAGEMGSALFNQCDHLLGRETMVDFDRSTGTVRIPARLTVDGRTPDVADPAERALLCVHNRAVLEELTHAEGFSVRPGEYTPLTARVATFGAFIRTPEGQRWAHHHGLTDSQIQRLWDTLHEADVVEVLRTVNPFSPSELARYPVRVAFELWAARR